MCALRMEKCNPLNLPTTNNTDLRKKYKYITLHLNPDSTDIERGVTEHLATNTRQ